MSLIGGQFGYALLKLIHPGNRPFATVADEYGSSSSKLQVHFGDDFFAKVRDKTVIDFGSGHGGEAVEIAKHAKQVVGVEIQSHFREIAAQKAVDNGVVHNCTFAEQTDTKADIVLSLDSFEHFEDPGKILDVMAGMLKNDGEIWVSFGLSWFHPHGGHLFSVFPWAHLVFSEEALIRWRSDFKSDGATKFKEVAGGLNQMTIARFEKLVAEAGLRFVEKRLVPIRKLRFLHRPLTREFTTSLIFGRIKKHD